MNLNRSSVFGGVAAGIIALLFSIQVNAQCGACTSCSVSTSSGCTWTVSSSSSTDYTVGAGQKLCITGGTYTGDITIEGGTIAVASGATFNPSSWTFGIFGTYGGVLEVQSGANATIPGMSYNGASGSFNFRNCGTTAFSSNININGSSPCNIYNTGTINMPARDYNLNGTGSVCNSGTLICDDFNANGSGSSTITNHGYIQMNGDFNQNGTCGVDLCSGGLFDIDGDFNSNGGTITGQTSCGAMAVAGSSLCNSCTVTGTMDFCDGSASQPVSNPTFDTELSATIGGSVTHCTCSSLPIELLSFNAYAERGRVYTSWKSATEINNDFYTIERSADGRNFTVAGTVKGAGNSQEMRTYAFVDDGALPGISYYRLRQTDFDGQTTVFAMVAVSMYDLEPALMVSPNPARGMARYVVYARYAEEAALQVTNMLGQYIAREKINLEKGANSLPVNVADWPAGTYILHIRSGHVDQQTIFLVEP